jgi:hypothetical protein
LQPSQTFKKKFIAMNKKLLLACGFAAAGFIGLTAFGGKTLEQQKAEIAAQVAGKLDELRATKEQECTDRVNLEAQKRFDEYVAAQPAAKPTTGKKPTTSKGPSAKPVPPTPPPAKPSDPKKDKMEQSQSGSTTEQKKDKMEQSKTGNTTEQKKAKMQKSTGGGN